MPRLLAALGTPWRHPARAICVMLGVAIAIALTQPARVLAVLLVMEALWLAGAIVHFRGARATNQALSRAAAAFAAFTLAGVVLCYVVLIYRASPTQVDYAGVYLTPGEEQFTVGTEAGVDVHLAATPDSSPGWHVAITGPRDGHFHIDSVDGIDGLGLRSHGELTVLRGVRMSEATPRATLTWQDTLLNQSMVVTLVLTSQGTRALVAGGDTATMPTPSDSACEQSMLLRGMASRRLRAGASLDQLHWSPGGVPTWAHYFSLRDSSSRWLQEPSLRCGHWYAPVAAGVRRLLSRPRDEELALTARLPVANIAEAAVASDAAVGDTVVVWSAGSTWEFALDINQRNDAMASAAVRFVRNPRPRLSAFPSASDCALVTTECGLISSHPISGSGPLLLLGAIGLDTARYALLARAEQDRDTIRVITADTIRTLPINGEIGLTAEPIIAQTTAPDHQGPGYLLRFHQLTPADIGRVLLACLGLLALWASAWLFAGGAFLSWREEQVITIPTPLQRAGWLIGMCMTPLFGLRLVLGLRISEAAPYVGRGRDTAFAIVATAALGAIVILRQHALSQWWRAAGLRHALERVVAVLVIAVGVLLLMQPRPGFVAMLVTFVVLGLLLELSLSGGRLHRLWRWWWPPREVLLAVTGLILVLRFGVAEDAPKGALLFGVKIVAIALWAGFAFLFPRSRWKFRDLSAPSCALALTFVLLLVGLLGQPSFVARPALFAGVLLGLNALIAAAGPLVLVTAPAIIALLLLGADAGLALVTGIPLCLAYLLALPEDAPHRDWQRGFYVVAMLGAVLILTRTLLAPDTTTLRDRMIGQHATVAEQAAAFSALGHVAGINVAARTSGARALVRGLAAHDPDLLEHVLVVAGLSAAQQEIPRSLEQVQGGIAYAVSGWGGKGLVSPAPLGRGVPTAVAYAENTFSVFILHEHGLIGGLLVLLFFLAMPVILAVSSVSVRRADRRHLAFPIAAVLLVSGPAFYVAAANIGVAPLTGQNIPFLGLNAWVDVLLYGGLAAQFFAVVVGAGRPAQSVGVIDEHALLPVASGSVT